MVRSLPDLRVQSRRRCLRLHLRCDGECFRNSYIARTHETNFPCSKTTDAKTLNLSGEMWIVANLQQISRNDHTFALPHHTTRATHGAPKVAPQFVSHVCGDTRPNFWTGIGAVRCLPNCRVRKNKNGKTPLFVYGPVAWF